MCLYSRGSHFSVLAHSNAILYYLYDITGSLGDIYAASVVLLCGRRQPHARRASYPTLRPCAGGWLSRLLWTDQFPYRATEAPASDITCGACPPDRMGREYDPGGPLCGLNTAPCPAGRTFHLDAGCLAQLRGREVNRACEGTLRLFGRCRGSQSVPHPVARWGPFADPPAFRRRWTRRRPKGRGERRGYHA